MNGRELKVGDLVFNIRSHTFGNIYRFYNNWDDVFKVEEEHPHRIPGTSVYLWAGELTIRVDGDVSKKRLMLQLKYSE